MTKNGIKTRFYGNHYGYLDNHCINFFYSIFSWFNHLLNIYKHKITLEHGIKRDDVVFGHERVLTEGLLSMLNMISESKPAEQ